MANLVFLFSYKYNFRFTNVFLSQSKVETPKLAPIFIDLLAVKDIPFLKDFSSTTSTQSAFFDKLQTPAFLVMDRDSAVPLFAKNIEETFYPASTVKLMTALVTLDLYSLTDEIVVNKNDLKFGNSLGFRVGERLTIEALLQAMLIVSSNEAAVILANHSSAGSYENFISVMNEKAKQLNLKSTNFINPTGIDHQDQRSSVLDLAILTQFFLKNQFLTETVAIKKILITDVAKHYTYLLNNTNQLLDNQQYFGVKTGTTNLASQVLISLVKKDNHSLIVVVLKSQNRYNDTEKLTKETFTNYQWLSF